MYHILFSRKPWCVSLLFSTWKFKSRPIILCGCWKVPSFCFNYYLLHFSLCHQNFPLLSKYTTYKNQPYSILLSACTNKHQIEEKQSPLRAFRTHSQWNLILDLFQLCILFVGSWKVTNGCLLKRTFNVIHVTLSST